MAKQRLSVVTCGRNDGYYVNPGLVERFVNFIVSLRESFADFDLDIICVQYNNPENSKPLYKEILGMGIRWIVVSSEIHKQIGAPDQMTMCEYYAKNIGIRRAQGQFVLTCNPDITFDSQFMRRLVPNTLYYAAKWHLLKNGTPRHQKRADINWALGDFTLIDKESWEQLKGFVELPIWGGCDSLFAYDCIYAGKNVMPMDDFILLHLDHHLDSEDLIKQRETREQYKLPIKVNERRMRNMIKPNVDTWGFSNIDFMEVLE